jgi:putative resolvase
MGTLPVPAQRVGSRMILVNVQADTVPGMVGGVGLHGRVSSRDRRTGLERQVARLSHWAVAAAHHVVWVESEIASGMGGGRVKARRLPADPKVKTVVVGHRDRLGRMNTEPVGAWLEAGGRRLLALDDGQAEDDLVQDLVEILTSLGARLHGHRSAGDRAHRAWEAAAGDG